jgi:hypothetical protein
MKILVQRFHLGLMPDTYGYLLLLSEPVVLSYHDSPVWIRIWAQHGKGYETEVAPMWTTSQTKTDELYLKDVQASLDQGWVWDDWPFEVEPATVPNGLSDEALREWVSGTLLPTSPSGPRL